jgi:hypothetical protein
MAVALIFVLQKNSILEKKLKNSQERVEQLETYITSSSSGEGGKIKVEGNHILINVGEK